MLNKELKECQNYLNKQHSNNELLKEIIKLHRLTRGELFDILLEFNKEFHKKSKRIFTLLAIIICQLIILISMILQMLL